MKILKPDFGIESSEYGWVLNVANKKAALAAWGERYIRLFEISITDEWWNDCKMSRIEHRAYCQYAALRWPDLLHYFPPEYEDPTISAGSMMVIINRNRPGWQEIEKRFEAILAKLV